MSIPKDGDRVEVRTQGVWRAGRRGGDWVETDPVTRYGLVVNPKYDVVEVIPEPITFQDGDVVAFGAPLGWGVGVRKAQTWTCAPATGVTYSDDEIRARMRDGYAWRVDVSKPKDA